MDTNNKKKRSKEDKAYLSWKREDFIKANEEIPDSLMEDDFHTEGELMNEQQILDWIIDTRKTFSVIKQNDQETFDKLYAEYVKDLEYLVELGKIDKETMEDLLNKNNFEF